MVKDEVDRSFAGGEVTLPVLVVIPVVWVVDVDIKLKVKPDNCLSLCFNVDGMVHDAIQD